MSEARVSRYVLTLPSQPSNAAEEVERVNDTSAGMIVEILLAGVLILGAFTLIFELAVLPWRLLRGLLRSISIPKPRPVRALLVVVVTLGYVALNASLFLLAPLQWDEVGAKVWSYVAQTHGVADLYYQPLIVTLATVAKGVPVHEAAFPYGATSAYLYQLIGGIYEGALHRPPLSSAALDMVIKSFNLLFALADGVLIYLISRPLLGRSAVQPVVLFLFCPAVVFVMSIWGSTETFSLFFVLTSIWFAEKERPLPAYLALAAAALTRPQMMVLAFLLGLLYIRKFGLVNSLVAASWTLLATFAILAPFELAIGPSFVVDYISRTLSYHLANGQADPNYLGLTPGYYSVWTLPLELVSHQHALARMWSPSNLPLWGAYTYGQIAAIASAATVGLVGLALVLVKAFSSRPLAYVPTVAFGMMAWLMITPGLISRYFVYAIALIVLTRPFWKLSTYLWMFATVTLVTFITAYGHLALDSLGNLTTESVLNPSNNLLSRFVLTLFSDDRFITVGAVANIVVVALLAAKAWELAHTGSRADAVTETHAAVVTPA